MLCKSKHSLQEQVTSFFITRTGNHVFDHMRTIYDHTLDKYQIPFQLLLVKYQYSKFRISPSQLLLNIKYHRKSYQISAQQISNTITTTIRYQTISTTIKHKILLQLLLNMYKFSNIITITIECQISAQQFQIWSECLGCRAFGSSEFKISPVRFTRIFRLSWNYFSCIIFWFKKGN